MKKRTERYIRLKNFITDLSNVLFGGTDSDSGGIFSRMEREIALILMSFINFKKFDINKSYNILREVFYSYSEKIYRLNSYSELKALVKLYHSEDINVDRSCRFLSKELAKYKLFLLYNLFDIAAADNLYSIEEEQFIDTIRKKIKVHSNTLNSIKASYIKKGLQEERQIIEEENRKKLAKSFLPYNAYKVLGITPDVTKEQLKKVYRKLAKKYHPDKFYGQSEEVIEKAEEKFQEITKAYKIIEAHKNF